VVRGKQQAILLILHNAAGIDSITELQGGSNLLQQHSSCLSKGGQLLL
jgi:hypothetical protein